MAPAHSPRRIACLQPSATVILASVGALDRVVACTKYCADVVPEVRNSGRRILADSWAANADEIVAAQPDLVIAAVPYGEKAVGEILKAGVRVLALAPHTLDDIYTDVAMIGSLVDAGRQAEDLIANMQSEIETVRRQTANLQKKRVFCEEWGKPIIASQPWVAELVSAAGGNILGEPGKPCDPDQIRRQDPEVIIAAWCGAGDRVPLAKIINERGWTETSAARKGRVYCMSDELLNTPAPTLIAGLRAVAAAIHPELFDVKGLLRSIGEISVSR